MPSSPEIIHEVITHSPTIEELFRQDQESEDAPVPEKVQEILTNDVWNISPNS